jgi:hypothetical protein
MKTEFSQGETLFAKISGSFTKPILRENIFFYRGHTKIPINFEITKINNDIYLFAQLLGKNQDNYSIALNDIQYFKFGQIVREDISKNFSITNNTADFLINPGFIKTNKNFSIELQNLMDHETIININSNQSSEKTTQTKQIILDLDQKASVVLSPGEMKKIYFNIEKITQPTLTSIELNTEKIIYSIPVQIFVKEIEQPEITKNLQFEPFLLDIFMQANSTNTTSIYLFNTGEQTLINITLNLSESLKPHISLSSYEISELLVNQSTQINLSISSKQEQLVTGRLTSTGSNESEIVSADLKIVLDFSKVHKPEKQEEQEPVIIETCSDLNGIICQENQECSGEIKYAKDGNCCLGECLEKEQSHTGVVIGWLIITAIVIILIWFFARKYGKAKKEINLFKIAKGKK